VGWQIFADTVMSFRAPWKLGTSWLSEKILASEKGRSQDVSLSCEIALACYDNNMTNPAELTL
jgi:hypothetical protein